LNGILWVTQPAPLHHRFTEVGSRPREQLWRLHREHLDKQRITAVSILEALGYRFAPNEWKAPAGMVSLVREAEQMHALLAQRADHIDGCTENSPAPP
jgi:uncharacterized protein YjeT (DUF2065 family)